jgi:DNA-binding ferritin-like protein
MNGMAKPSVNDAEKANRQKLMALINQLLVNGIDLHMQAKQTRWQLTDPKLSVARSLCDQVAEEIDEEIQALIRWASQLVTDCPDILSKGDLPSNLSKYPFAICAQTDHLRALAHSLRAFMTSSLNSAVTAKKLGDRKAGNTFAHIARVPSRLAKDLKVQVESIQANVYFDEVVLSIWVGEGGAYDHTGQSAVLSG